MAAIDPQRIYAPEEAAEILGVSRSTVSVLLRDQILRETESRGQWGITGGSLLREHRYRSTTPGWRRALRVLRRNLDWLLP